MLSRLPRCVLSTTRRYSKYSTSSSHANNSTPDFDELGLPTAPTWSVNELINSYPPVELSDEMLARLHRSAALVLPEDPIKLEKIRGDLTDLIKVVEAVRMAPLPTPHSSEQPQQPQSDGRIWPEGVGMDLRDYSNYEVDKQSTSTPPEGRELLTQVWAQDGYYLVPCPSQLKLFNKGS